MGTNGTWGGREAVPRVPGSEGHPRGATGRGLRGPGGGSPQTGGVPSLSPRLPVPRARTSGSRRGEASSAAPRRPQAGGGARSSAGRGAPGPPPPPAPRPWRRRRRRLRSGGRPLPSPHPEARPHLPEPESTPGRPVRAPPRRYRALAARWARLGARPPPSRCHPPAWPSRVVCPQSPARRLLASGTAQ